MNILWLIIIGFIAGIIAKFLHPGSSIEPSGFILTTLLGIAGSFVATYLGQALGWYQAGEGAGLHRSGRGCHHRPGHLGNLCPAATDNRRVTLRDHK